MATKAPKTPKQLRRALTRAESLPAAAAAESLAGVVDAASLPTADPSVAGRLWVDAGVVKVSAG